MKKLVLLLLLLTPLCTAQGIEKDLTSGFPNGRFWHRIDRMGKLIYVMAFSDGIAAGPGTSDERVKAVEHYMASSNHGELIDGIDKLYEQPENAMLPIVWIMEVFSMKARGATPNEIGDRLASYRKHAAAYASK
jgi:hypothetical protein